MCPWLYAPISFLIYAAEISEPTSIRKGKSQSNQGLFFPSFFSHPLENSDWSPTSWWVDRSNESDTLGWGLSIYPFKAPRWFSRAAQIEISSALYLSQWVMPKAPGTLSCIYRAALNGSKQRAWPAWLTYSVGVWVLILLVSSRLKGFSIHPVQNHTLKVTVTSRYLFFPMAHLFTLLKKDRGLKVHVPSLLPLKK